MKIAIVHPWFLEAGGGEKVVECLAGLYPKADIFALSSDPRTLFPGLKNRKIYTSYLDSVIRHGFHFKRACFMPFMPAAVESMDVSKYDVVISSCGPAVMGVNPNQDAIHVSYIHSPQRAWWDLYASRQTSMPWVMKQLFIQSAVRMRMFEFGAMQRVDHVVSNSRYIARRVAKYFRRQSTVIYPPVETSRGYISDSHGDYYLTVSRLDVDKRIDILIEACNKMKRRLVIAGTGRMEKHLKPLAGPTIEFVGRIPDEKLHELYARCRAFLFAADEDFGIVPVEAQSFGRPVIAYGHGGSLETVRVNDENGKCDTGVYFTSQTVESALKGLMRFEDIESTFSPEQIREHSRKFDTAAFIQQFQTLVNEALHQVGKKNYTFTIAG